MMKPMEYRKCNHLMSVGLWQWGNCQRDGNLLINALMGTAVIEESDILTTHTTEMTLVEDQDMIQTLAPNTAEKTFAN